MILGIPRETFPDERRVSIVPETVPLLKKLGVDVLVESDAGASAGFQNSEYEAKGAKVVSNRNELFNQSHIITQIRTFGANSQAGESDLSLIKPNQIIIGTAEPLTSINETKKLAKLGATLFALELLPRITRAQEMDILSSMATVAGYKAVLLAADYCPRMFPLMMTAAGTVKPAKVFIVGAGVAGLQAISTAKRLGAIVHAYDVRSAVKEQIQSLGGKFVEIELDTKQAEGTGGYAKEMSEEMIKKQREMMFKIVAESDVVITTAAVPGRKAPLLVTSDMIKGMTKGSVIVDLAAERGGNCEPTKPGEIIDYEGVTIIGTTNLPSTIPFHASQMFSRNLFAFIKHFVKNGEATINPEDEILKDTLVIHNGNVVHNQVSQLVNSAS